MGDRALLDIVVWVGASGGSDAAHDADACGTQNSACGPQAGSDGATEPDLGARKTARMELPEEGQAAGGGRGESFESGKSGYGDFRRTGAKLSVLPASRTLISSFI